MKVKLTPENEAVVMELSKLTHGSAASATNMIIDLCGKELIRVIKSGIDSKFIESNLDHQDL